MELLQSYEQADLPADYLFARVRSRRALLDTSGAEGWAGTGDPWQGLRQEYVWVYLRLGRKLLRSLRPVFEYAELRSIVLGLRYLAAQDRSAMEAQLCSGLLHRQLRQTLLATRQVPTAVTALERLLAPSYPFCSGLAGTYLRQGPGGVEQALVGGYLQQAVAGVRQPLVGMFFRYLVDMRNLLALYKHLHWQLRSPPPLVTGGELSQRRLQRVWKSGDQEGVARLTQQLSGLDADPATVGIEELLHRGLSRRLQRAGRDPLHLGLLLDYLWRCQITARNRGLRLQRGEPLGSSGEEWRG